MIKQTSIKTCSNSKKNIATLSLSKKSAFISPAQKNTLKINSNKKFPIIKENYYDIPYTYNDTVIKVLAQNPYTLFVYWDISDVHRKYLIEKYGDNFFYNTRPFLAVKNESNGNYFEIEVSDFTNNWYINVEDTKCKYKITLIRKSISEETQIENNYLEITSSNICEIPNDHVLINELPNEVPFFNVKTNVTTEVKISNLIEKNAPSFASIHKLYGNYKDLKKESQDSSSSNFFTF